MDNSIPAPDSTPISPTKNSDIEISEAVTTTPEELLTWKQIVAQNESPEDRIDRLDKDHENLHKTIQLLLSTSGLLLTICLGILYFNYNSNFKYI